MAKKKRTVDKAKAARGKAKYKKKKALEKQRRKEARRLKREATAKKISLKFSGSTKKQRKEILDVPENLENKVLKNECKPNQSKNSDKKTGVIILLIILVLLLVAVLTGLGIYKYRQKQAKQASADAATEAMLQTQAMAVVRENHKKHQSEELLDNTGKHVVEALIAAGMNTVDGVEHRPPTVELSEEQAKSFLNIGNCIIEDGKIKMGLKAQENALIASDDGYYYMFGLAMYEHELSGEPVGKELKDVDFIASCEYSSVRLYKKYQMAIKKDGSYIPISGTHYVTNPEQVASYHPGFYNTSSKKGLLVDPSYVQGNSLVDLGVKHAAYNIPISRILGPTTNGNYPTIGYSYHGKNYSFNGQSIAEYDLVFSNLTNKGIEITAILLNDRSGNTANLIHPRSSGGSAHYYAFNNTTEEGIETMAAVGSFLAGRYSGTGHGKIMNWVIGNEVNARRDWNYTEYMDVGEYSRIYADSIRVFYNSIKSTNGNARIYISIDQQWNRNRSNTDCYDARDIVDELNKYIVSEGNIDWCVAQHPYNYPLDAVHAWNMGRYENLITNSADTSIITMKNINVLTNYLQREELLNTKGEVRRVILSEVGYTSSKGQELQAANFVYAYKKIVGNPYIDSILLNRQTDHGVEIAQGLALGIQTPGGGQKYIYNVFKYIDTAQSNQYCDFALSYIGISSWNQLK